jgi:hypothetical protein
MKPRDLRQASAVLNNGFLDVNIGKEKLPRWV